MVSKTNASNMNQDFALRKEGSTQSPGIANILHAVYTNPSSQAMPTRGMAIDEMGAFALQSLPTAPTKELYNPICQKEVHVNPSFRTKYKLPKKKPSPWFDHGAYTSTI